VASGEPGVPVVSICWAWAEGATASIAAAYIPPKRTSLADFMDSEFLTVGGRFACAADHRDPDNPSGG
jgi:hypothetical protein